MSAAGLIYGPEYHHLDHLAPLCALRGIPLIVTEERLAKLAKLYYPDLTLLHWNQFEVPDKLVFQFDTIFYSTPRKLFDQVFFLAEKLQNKKITTIWCPHGNSDKGRATTFMEMLAEEERILTYGNRIESFIREKGVTVPFTRIGNYRLAYYEKHKTFYDKVVREKLPSEGKKTLLYAPTWQDFDKNSSFLALWAHLHEVPSEYFLIVKLHPNLYLQYPNEIETLKKKAPSHFQLLEEFPPIYPLLSQVDLYIGDVSSVGYDFLAFNRPMLFLRDQGLAKAGKLLQPKEFSNLFNECEALLGTKPDHTSLYGETFEPFDPDALSNFHNKSCDIVL